MRPVNAGGCWVDVEDETMDSQIVAIVRTKHQAVAKQTHRIAVCILGGVYNVDMRHMLLYQKV